MHLISILMRIFFHLLYHQFAWTYDLVAAVVSLGRWQEWVKCALPHLQGRVLEIGFGPGHLQEALHEKGLTAFGLDESRQMARQAGHRLRRGKFPVRLSRGYAQRLPFSNISFETVVVTFPSEYFFDVETLSEIRRVLAGGGKLVLVPVAWITGKGLLERLAAGLFRVTGQAGVFEMVVASTKKRLQEAGFVVRHEVVDLPGSRVLVLVAREWRKR